MNSASLVKRATWSLAFLSNACLVLVLPIADLARADQVTISSTNDGELDEHANWNNSPKGHYTNCYQHTCEFMYAGRLADDYTDPVVGPSKFSVMKFDVSSLAGQTINSVTLRLIQTFDPASIADFPYDTTVRAGMTLAPTTEVYAVHSGEDFDENSTTWRTFTNDFNTPTDASRNAFLNSGAISPLGSMANVVNPGGVTGPGAPVTFVDTGLTALVQDWIDNPSTNLGLLLLNSTTLTGAPAAPADTVARYATHESRTENPAHDWDGPQLIISYGAVGTPGDYNGNGTVDAADYTLWRKGGPLQNDSTPGVQPGDYDVWRANFGNPPGAGSGVLSQSNVPEPSSLVLLLTGVLAFVRARRRTNV